MKDQRYRNVALSHLTKLYCIYDSLRIFIMYYILLSYAVYVYVYVHDHGVLQKDITTFRWTDDLVGELITLTPNKHF